MCFRNSGSSANNITANNTQQQACHEVESLDAKHTAAKVAVFKDMALDTLKT